MKRVDRSVIIDAPPETLFDLICRVEDFEKYSSAIEEVRAVGDKKFLWRVSLLGITFKWEAEITESVRPVSFAWRSISGVYNSGRYLLTPIGQRSTKVSFALEYRLKNRLTECLTAPLAASVMTALFDEILGNVKKRVERQA